MWPLFGTANQMLAAIALTLCTVVLFKMKRQCFAWVTIVPATWLVRLHRDRGPGEGVPARPAVGFVSHAMKFGAAAAAGQVLAPAKTLDEMSRVIFNDYLDAGLARARRWRSCCVLAVYAIIDIAKALGFAEQHRGRGRRRDGGGGE